jgi:hypothetical protein
MTETTCRGAATTFEGIDLSTDSPPGICPACAIHGVRHIPSGTHYVYCEHSNTGVVRPPDHDWIAFPGISAETYQREIMCGVMCSEIALDIVSDGATLQ